jgi:hypothetical protein
MPNEELNEGEFRARVVTALEKLDKPRKHLIVRLANSSATLWILSLIIFSVGGTVYGNRQQCFRDAEPLVAQYFPLVSLLGLRSNYYWTAIEQSATFHQMRMALEPNLSALRTMGKFLHDDAAGMDIIRSAARIENRVNRADILKYGSPFDKHVFDIEMNVNFVSTLAEVDQIVEYQKLKNDLRQEKMERNKRLHEEFERGLSPSDLTPYVIVDCGIWQTLKRMFTGEQSVLGLVKPIPIPYEKRPELTAPATPSTPQ